jgi:hypothetical protein
MAPDPGPVEDDIGARWRSYDYRAAMALADGGVHD